MADKTKIGERFYVNDNSYGIDGGGDALYSESYIADDIRDGSYSSWGDGDEFYVLEVVGKVKLKVGQVTFEEVRPAAKKKSTSKGVK